MSLYQISSKLKMSFGSLHCLDTREGSDRAVNDRREHPIAMVDSFNFFSGRKPNRRNIVVYTVKNRFSPSVRKLIIASSGKLNALERYWLLAWLGSYYRNTAL